MFVHHYWYNTQIEAMLIMKYFVCCLVEACIIIISRSWPRTCLCHFRTYDICEYLIKFKNTFDIFLNESWSFWLSYIFLYNLHLIPSLFNNMLITCTGTLKHLNMTNTTLKIYDIIMCYYLLLYIILYIICYYWFDFNV